MMDMRRWASMVVPVAAAIVLGLASLSHANMVFKVQHKFAGQPRNITAYKAHDTRRHERILSAVDLPLGGNGLPTEAGLYFAKIGLGNPSKDYYVIVDTGSDILWVSCIHCNSCPTKSDLGVDLTLYDPQSSRSSQLVNCNDDFCQTVANGTVPGCTGDLQCLYRLGYGDGSQTAGFFVRDTVHFEQVTGNLQTASTNGSAIFGCTLQQGGQLSSSRQALDGILGFGQASTSVISQLAAAGKVKRAFAHCLDNVNGGGIFAIGEVVSPKVDTTPLLPIKTHYNIALKSIEVGGNVLNLPPDAFQTGERKGTVIDSGTTLAYLSSNIYDTLMDQIKAMAPGGLNFVTMEQIICFQYSGKVDTDFPVVKFKFDGSLVLTIYPHDYLFQYPDKGWCFGWQHSDVLAQEFKDMSLLGDLVLSNKLVVYDMENQVIGMAEYNCSSSIQVKDENSGAVYTVAAHNVSSASRLLTARTAALLLLMFARLRRFI